MAADLLSQAEHGTDSQVVLVAINLSDEQLDVIQVIFFIFKKINKEWKETEAWALSSMPSLFR